MSAHNLSADIANVIFLALVAGIPLYGFCRKVSVYEEFVEGAKEGFTVAIKILPYLVAMIVAIGMFRASGAIDTLAYWLDPALNKIGMPHEVLPLALMRPFSGSASNGILAEIIKSTGPNSFASHVAATIMGSTETTFYVVAVYFGAVAIKKTRHAILAGLLADAAGVFAAIWICHLLFA